LAAPIDRKNKRTIRLKAVQDEQPQAGSNATYLLKAGIVSSVDTGQEQIDSEIKTGLEELKDAGVKPNPEEIEAVPERREVPNKETSAGAIAALEDRSGVRRPAVRYRNSRKRQTNVDAERGLPDFREE
jgi:hypothetical protein